MRPGAYERLPILRVNQASGRNAMELRVVSSFAVTNGKQQWFNWYIGTEVTWTLEKAKRLYRRLYALSEFQRQDTLKSGISERVDWKQMDLDKLSETYVIDTDFITEDYINNLFLEKVEKIAMQRYVIVNMTASNKNYPHGAFMARFYQGGKTVSQRSFSLGKHSQEEAYKKAVKAAKDLAAEQGCEIKTIKSMAELIKIAHSRTRTAKDDSFIIEDGSAGSELMTIMSHKLRFRALVKKLCQEYTAERVKENFEDIIGYIDVLNEESIKEAKTIEEAHMKMAQAILDARAQGIAMVAPSPEIEVAIKKIQMEQKNES